MATDGGISISLAPEHFSFVDACVSSGRYRTREDVIRAGLEMLRERESQGSPAVERVREMIEQGARELDSGQVVDGEDVFRRLQRKHEALAANSSSES